MVSAGGDEQRGGDPERRAPADAGPDRTEHGGGRETEAEGDAVDPHREPALGGPGGDADALQTGREEQPGGDAQQRLTDEQRGVAVRERVDDAAGDAGDGGEPNQRDGCEATQSRRRRPGS